MRKYLVGLVVVLSLMLSSVSVFGATNSDVEALKEAGYLKEDPANLNEPFKYTDWIHMMYNKDGFGKIRYFDPDLKFRTGVHSFARYYVKDYGDAPDATFRGMHILGREVGYQRGMFSDKQVYNKSMFMYNIYNYTKLTSKEEVIKLDKASLLDQYLVYAYQLKHKDSKDFKMDYKVGNSIIKIDNIGEKQPSDTTFNDREFVPVNYTMLKAFLDNGILKSGDVWGNTSGYITKAEAYELMVKIFKAEGVSLENPFKLNWDEEV